MITQEEIEKEARDRTGQLEFFGNPLNYEETFKKGANWAIQKLGFQPMSSMPSDKFVLLGLFVNSNKRKRHWESYYAEWHSEDECFYDQNGEGLPWPDKEDYDAWMPIPEFKQGEK